MNENPGDDVKVAQITHNDLDGYGAALVAAAHADVTSVTHVARYRDVVPLLEKATEAALAAAEPVTLLVTDIAVEPAAACALASAGARLSEAGHRIVVIDHHASSAEALEQAGWAKAGGSWSVPGCTAIVEVGKSATRIAFERHSEYACGPSGDDALPRIVAMVDAVDLWDKDSPAFAHGMALNDAFWDCASTYIPPSHPKHEAFVQAILRGMAALAASGSSVEAMERSFGEVRAAAAMQAAGRSPEPGQTTRMLLASMMAEDLDGFASRQIGRERALVSFAMDTGIFQRVSDSILDNGRAALTINVMRGGGLSLRSRNGSALSLALLLGGGGHVDMAGAELPSGKVFSLEDALSQLKAATRSPGSAK